MIGCRSLIIKPSQLWLSHCSRAFTGTGQLQLWHAAVKRIPVEEVLPAGFGGRHEVATPAWYGDKILALAIAEELKVRGTKLGPENLSRHLAAAASNENMSNQLEAILPSSHLEMVPRENQVVQTHNCGTMLEACVSYVNDAGNNAAVAELARYLLDSPTQHIDGPSSPVVGLNSKGKLLELGGSVDTIKASGSDHQPIFQTEARLFSKIAVADGSSKKGAEKDAAMAVLKLAGLSSASQPTQLVRFDAMKLLEESNDNSASSDSRAGALTWTFQPPFEAVANLKNGESHETYFRRRPNCLHRIFMSPHIFPGSVRKVDAWRGRVEEGSLYLLYVHTAGDDVESRLFISPRPVPSNTKAAKTASELAHAYILNLAEGREN